MNYEQKYKEVKELIKDCTPDKDGYIHVRPSDIFPELAESKGERIRKDIIHHIEFDKSLNIIPCERAESWIAYLEKQASAHLAWSEEDARMLNEVILDLTLLKDKDTGEAGKAAYQKEIDWLKSLKERCTWKPSDEQMDALNEAINNYANSPDLHENSYLYNLLLNLRMQLKKLREE